MSNADGQPTARGWTADDSTFGARLALIRQHMGWGNVREAATACGIPAETWRTWERDGAMPRQYEQVCRRIADACGADLHWLLTGDHTSFPQLPILVEAVAPRAGHQPKPTSPRPHPRPKPSRNLTAA